MGVSKNMGTPKSSILVGFSIINHPFWGTTIFGNTHISIYTCMSTPARRVVYRQMLCLKLGFLLTHARLVLSHHVKTPGSQRSESITVKSAWNGS